MKAYVPTYSIEENTEDKAESTAEGFLTHKELTQVKHEIIMTEAIGGEDIMSVEVHVAIPEDKNPENVFQHAESVREAQYEF